MKRALLNSFTGICLLCCIAILVVRSASFYGQIFAAYDHSDGTRTVLWNEGGNLLIEPHFEYASFNFPFSEIRTPKRWHQLSSGAYWYADPLQLEEWMTLSMPQRSFAGFGIDRATETLKPSTKPVASIRLISVPHWFLVVLFALFPCIRAYAPLKRAYGRHEWLRRSIAYGVTGISGFSALSVVVLLGIWIRSHYVGDEFFLTNAARSKLMMLAWGQGGLGWFTHELPPIELYQGQRLTPRSENYRRIKPPRYPNQMFPYAYAGAGILGDTRATFLFQDQQNNFGMCRQVTVPIWSLICVSGALTVPGMIQFRRKLKSSRLTHAGLCSACGYDLRATPERCPECGAVSGSSVRLLG